MQQDKHIKNYLTKQMVFYLDAVSLNGQNYVR